MGLKFFKRKYLRQKLFQCDLTSLALSWKTWEYLFPLKKDKHAYMYLCTHKFESTRFLQIFPINLKSSLIIAKDLFKKSRIYNDLCLLQKVIRLISEERLDCKLDSSILKLMSHLITNLQKITHIFDYMHKLSFFYSKSLYLFVCCLSKIFKSNFLM